MTPGGNARAATPARRHPEPAFAMRWFGPNDPVSLAELRQVPGLRSIVTALDDVQIDQPWTRPAIEKRAAALASYGFDWVVAESVPVPDAIKLGTPERDDAVACFASSIEALGQAGVNVVCYNFMPVFDWYRTAFHADVGDGSTAMRFRQADFDALDFGAGAPALAAWARGYDAVAFEQLTQAYRDLGERGLRENLTAFLHDVVPIAARAGVRLAIHPDDPPWPILGLPRIVKDRADLVRVLEASDDPANGLTFCTGALGARRGADLAGMAGDLVDRIHFVHARNLRFASEHDFIETAHLRGEGDLDLPAVMHALLDGGFDGPIRPDHGRTLWGEERIPGYGLFDRAIGLGYLQGLTHGRRSSG